MAEVALGIPSLPRVLKDLRPLVLVKSCEIPLNRLKPCLEWFNVAILAGHPRETNLALFGDPQTGTEQLQT